MNIIHRMLTVASAAFFIASSAFAQNSGTATIHAFAIGKGPGATGFTSLLCGSAQLAVGQSAADPICKTITGDWTLSAAGAATLATVNSNVGSFGSATQSVAITVNAKGLITAASVSTITPAIGSVTGLGAGCSTFLATPSSANLRSCLTDEVGTGAAYFVGGALGTPASATLTNATGLPPSGLTTQGAYTFLGNNTGSAASPTAVDVAGLTTKASPGAGDYVMISDQAASGAWKKTTVSALSGGGGAVSSLNGQTGALTLFSEPQGRLTLATGIAVMTSTVSSATTVYYTPSNGNIIPIYDGTQFVPTVFAEVSQLTTDTTKSPAAATTNSNYDVFAWNDGGTVRATRGPAWSSNTSRGTGAGTTELEILNGLYVNKNAITNGPAARRGTFVGTIHTNGTSTVDYSVGGSGSGGIAGSLGVWNAYNRNLSNAQSIDTGAGYTYSSGTVRQARASSGNQVSAVVGLAVDTINVTYQSRADTAAVAAAYGIVGIGEDSASTQSVRSFTRTVAAVSFFSSALVSLVKTPLLGYHTYYANEAGDGANNTTFDNDSSATLTLQVWN